MSAPTATRFAELEEAVRRNPGSPAFVDLGEALIAAGRPREAVDVGIAGLRLNPQLAAGRMMISRAFVALQNWKEAQVELLKLVKVDRNHGPAFCLLGEVLLRRSDRERAIPVLQHAQSLMPADKQVLSLLRAARSHEELGELAIPAAVAGTYDGDELDEAPTALHELDRRAAPAGALGRVALERREVERQVAPPAPRERVRGGGGDRRHLEADVGGALHAHVPAPEDPLAPLAFSPSSAVQPRLLPAEKPKDAAQASLRRSARVGEQYLNDLLTGGLLEIPSVAVSDVAVRVPKGKKWGRSGTRVFAYLFALLFVGVGSAGYWYWYSEGQERRDIDRYLRAAVELSSSGDQSELAKANEEALAALERDRSQSYTMVVWAHVAGLSSLLYGDVNPGQVSEAIGAAQGAITSNEQRGYRELVMARASTGLADLDTATAGQEELLNDIVRELDTWLQGHPEDALAHWLRGRAMLLAGDLKGAAASFQGASGHPLGKIALADMALDRGDFSTAIEGYDAALAESPKHAYAFVGRALARAERAVDVDEAMADLSVGLAQSKGRVLVAHKHLAAAFAALALEDYTSVTAELKAIDDDVHQPRFLARLALAHVAVGDIVAAAGLRAQIRWVRANPDPHPLVVLLDAELLLARGQPAEALKLVEARSDFRGLWLAGRALFDMGEAKQAVDKFEPALALAEDNLLLQAWTEAARFVAERGEKQRLADDNLVRLGRTAKSKVPRLLHGLALAAVGRSEEAQVSLEKSIEGLEPGQKEVDEDNEYPNPFAYRAYVALGLVELRNGNNGRAGELAGLALKRVPGYLPARDLMGQVLATSDPEAARPHLLDVIDAGVASAGTELALVAVTKAQAGSNSDARALVVEALRRAREKGASSEELKKAVEGLDPEIAADAGVSSSTSSSRRRRR